MEKIRVAENVKVYYSWALSPNFSMVFKASGKCSNNEKNKSLISTKLINCYGRQVTVCLNYFSRLVKIDPMSYQSIVT